MVRKRVRRRRRRKKKNADDADAIALDATVVAGVAGSMQTSSRHCGCFPISASVKAAGSKTQGETLLQALGPLLSLDPR